MLWTQGEQRDKVLLLWSLYSVVGYRQEANQEIVSDGDIHDEKWAKVTQHCLVK